MSKKQVKQVVIIGVIVVVIYFCWLNKDKLKLMFATNI